MEGVRKPRRANTYPPVALLPLSARQVTVWQPDLALTYQPGAPTSPERTQHAHTDTHCCHAIMCAHAWRASMEGVRRPWRANTYPPIALLLPLSARLVTVWSPNQRGSPDLACDSTAGTQRHAPLLGFHVCTCMACGHRGRAGIEGLPTPTNRAAATVSKTRSLGLVSTATVGLLGALVQAPAHSHTDMPTTPHDGISQ
jgi:hypothetical protein